ncbi:MAG: electron transporter SCO1/SenC [Hyphomonadaceae bacterium]|nr:MAG: electron transporter SCO1/SenC [Hyphomonadaceae bacterium]
MLPTIALVALLGFAYMQIKGQAFRGAAVKDAISKTEGSCKGRAFAQIGGPFNLVNQDNQPVSEKSFIGRPALIYFGYTMCPDVCPTSLSLMGASIEELRNVNPALADKIQPILITIDPTRDTPHLLKQYVASGGFPRGLIGLTGSEAQVTAVAKAYKVGYRKVLAPQSAANYTMDHTSIMYLLDSSGKLATFFSDNTSPSEIAQCINSLGQSGL